MVGLLGLIDIHATILLIAIALDAQIPLGIIIGTAIFLTAKACIYIKDIGSATDILVAALILSSIFIAPPQWILFILAVIIGFKGLSSLAA
ncbi:MAG: hypothetical protein UW11_C0046G0004 [Parcubacteria group bacterium GW2011_GWA2_43_9b]|uniref:Prepilin type IV endopeptidase peptidase domain-containing protein n=1 Tax=Candidatus Portnoybacteria bacterium RIFCSPLOWO2_02_FULL_39_11 TaxID=1802001 RepID=A0A1G2FVE9_9BACT|nr:MAG: hypothetical protein UW11_C0046G0004 [Parcubacteria group bacterium GW2011_GWA2_43_9b]OGZ41787.1 MAG: hypothetical protein A3B04_01785 [Candidatus Portnoybacteria bacterium RIFCSPLOWO2_02_FULL_39_11]